MLGQGEGGLSHLAQPSGRSETTLCPALVYGIDMLPDRAFFWGAEVVNRGRG